MLKAVTGILALIDVNTSEPKVFWRGSQLAVEAVSVVERKVFLRVKRGTFPADLIADLRSNEVEVREVA